jgi:uncharacterized protein (TIGR03067 family)
MIPTSSVRLLCAALSCAAFGLSQYFRVAEAGEPGNELAWNSPRMLELKKDWDALASLVESKGNYARAVDLQGELLRRRLSDEDLRRLAASCRSLDASADYRDPFSNFVLVFIVKVFVNSEDWNNLTKLLSTRFPRYVGMHDYIESYLARHGSSRMRPILLLGDAYSGCRDPLVRYEIAGALRRGFAGFGIRAEEDEDFVRKAMRWYGKEKGNLVVNSDYGSNAARHEPDFYFDPAEYDTGLPGHHLERLFERKGSRAPPWADPGPSPAPLPPGRGAGKETGGFSLPCPDPLVFLRPVRGAVAKEVQGDDWPASSDGPAGGGSADSVEGTWQETGHKWNGASEDPNGDRFVVHGDTLQWIQGGKQYWEWRVSFEKSRGPRAIDLVREGVTTSAIYEVRGDRMRICFPSDPWLRPTSFTADEGSCETLRTFKRLKDTGNGDGRAH